MQGAISNIQALERWFRGVGAPFFTLSYYSTQSPTGQGSLILRNTKQTDLNLAWDLLASAVEDQTGFGRAQLHLISYDNEKGANNPHGRTNIDITSRALSPIQTAGIGAMPGVYGKDEIAEMIADAKERWEMEARIAALEAAPEPDFAEKIVAAVERISSTTIGAALAQKLLGGTPMPIPAPVNGVHSPDNQPQQSPTGEDDIDNELDNLEAIAAHNGMTLKQFLAKTAALAQSQPGVVSMLANQ